jgi:spermidine synthase
MGEKFQYGMQVTYQVEKVLQDFKTSKTHVQYVKTKYHGEMLLMDNEVQFSTLDEHRYHDLLVPEDIHYGSSVLILGGGDGLAARNVYKNDPGVKRLVLVDWDQEFVERFAMNYERNDGSLNDPRTRIVYMDALEFLRTTNEKYDTIIIDLPDPDNIEMQELYFKIVRSLGFVLKFRFTRVLSHVGPVSLCKEHPNWTFIKNFADELVETLHYETDIDLHYRYIPSFSHEWGVITGNAGCRHDKHELDDIRDMFPIFNDE